MNAHCEAVAVERPAAPHGEAAVERVRQHHDGVLLVAVEGHRREVEQLPYLPRDRREYVGRRRALGDERGHPA